MKYLLLKKPLCKNWIEAADNFGVHTLMFSAIMYTDGQKTEKQTDRWTKILLQILIPGDPKR